MSEVEIRKRGRAGRITLNRPEALNALNYDMCLRIDAALKGWVQDADVDLVVMDAAGPRAFCAGGDIAELYARGTAGDHAFGQTFWRDEYRMNARIADYPKPVVSLMQGFTMGGGVGLGCHASHRIVGETTQIAMPECAIGLVPDVGGTHLLAHAPGRVGVWLGLTGSRMGPGDAIVAGFADHFVPEAEWPDLIAALEEGRLEIPAHEPPIGRIPDLREEIDRLFAAESLAGIAEGLAADGSPFAGEALKAIARGSPLAMAATLEILHRLGPTPTMREALGMEYRFTYRAQAEADFLEGIRAAIIDKDRKPRWRHAEIGDVSPEEVAALLEPLGPHDLTFEEESI
ncbi:enoyl-CoA hydratase/isomerase family protein [Cereibacter sphaeroides]|uniref:enoyl-CoA hydratase/isomerase family protein n=1 Tax=Cereibacter sphaeroides TaxID=1063 RepID=UPI001F21A850|nr:enoyl-CoA hydratase/isomerase family protein [Cereibacter sphaeroides]MCE6952686.1 enoyl-CoA hydratase/isomerase family protein [Cereibacter sphaeroides]